MLNIPVFLNNTWAAIAYYKKIASIFTGYSPFKGLSRFFNPQLVEKLIF